MTGLIKALPEITNDDLPSSFKEIPKGSSCCYLLLDSNRVIRCSSDNSPLFIPGIYSIHRFWFVRALYAARHKMP